VRVAVTLVGPVVRVFGVVREVPGHTVRLAGR
jgi:hypothetical protein